MHDRRYVFGADRLGGLHFYAMNPSQAAYQLGPHFAHLWATIIGLGAGKDFSLDT
jgi:hypothetical protein